MDPKLEAITHSSYMIVLMRRLCRSRNMNGKTFLQSRIAHLITSVLYGFRHLRHPAQKTCWQPREVHMSGLELEPCTCALKIFITRDDLTLLLGIVRRPKAEYNCRRCISRSG